MIGDTIYFYRPQDGQYGPFSNFSRHGFDMAGERWRTAEHYFQAFKFEHSPVDFRAVIDAPTPLEAKRIGGDRNRPLREDWERVKDSIMYEALIGKFSEHKNLMDLLLSTGDRELVERAPYDYYWGCGARGTGKNMLGKLLMDLRSTMWKIEQGETLDAIRPT